MAKKLHYNFAGLPSLAGHDNYTSTPGTPDLSLTRATTAYMKDADGWLRTVQSGEARFPGATFSANWQVQSDDVSNAAWAKTNCTASDSETLLASVGTHAAYIEDSTRNAKAGEGVVFSIKAKAGTASYVWVGNRGNTPILSATFDLTDGSVVGSSNVTAGVDAVDADGYYRCWWYAERDISGTDSCNIAICTDAVHQIDRPSRTFAGTETILVKNIMVENRAGAWDSQNLIANSESTSAWTASQEGGTPVDVTGSVTGPAGLSSPTVLELPDDNGGGTGTVRHIVSFNESEPGSRVASFYVKQKSGSSTDWIAVRTTGYGHPAGQSYGTVYFNITTGTKGTDGSAGTSTIEDAGNGWYRISYFYELASNDLTGQSHNIYQVIGDGGSISITPRDDNRRIYVAGTAIEKAKPNQTAAGLYASTTGTAVTSYSPSDYIATTSAAVSSLSGANDGLLVEEARTNICLQSEDLSTTWTTSGVVNTDQTIAPDGSFTADQVIDNNATGTGTVVVSQTGKVVTTSTAYTMSAFLKADQLSFAFFELDNFTTPATNTRVWFNLSTGAVGTQNAGFSNAGVEDYGNGWYRCWGTFTTDAVDTAGDIRIGVADADNDTVVDLDGTSSIFVWGVQLEAGDFPTGYISTTTGSASRNDEDISTSDVSWYGTTGGTFYESHLIDFYGANVNRGLIYEINDGSGTPQIYYDVNPTSLNAQSNGSTDGAGGWGILTTDTPLNDNALNRSAVGFTTNDVALYINGIAEGTDTSSDVPGSTTAMTLFAVGSRQRGAPTLHINGLIKEIAYADERVSDSNLKLVSDGTLSVEQALGGNPAYIRKKARQRWRARYGRT